jgi:hypothetical protein
MKASIPPAEAPIAAIRKPSPGCLVGGMFDGVLREAPRGFFSADRFCFIEALAATSREKSDSPKTPKRATKQLKARGYRSGD